MNDLGTLKDMLMSQVFAITNEDVKGEDLKELLARTDRIVTVADAIVDIYDLAIKGEKLKNEYGISNPVTMITSDTLE